MDEDYLKSHAKKLVSQYIRKNFKSEETIICRFDMYRIDIVHEDKLDKYFWDVELTKREYALIIRTLLAYPNLTFQDLPHYIPIILYEKIIFQLRFPYHGNALQLYVAPSRSLPVAVEMTTLQKDAHEIGGEDMYSFSLPITQKNIRDRQDVHLRLKTMEITMWQYFGLVPRNTASYIDIDALEVERVLGVEDYKGIEQALNTIYQKMVAEADSEPLWLIHWLDANSISYIKSEDKKNNGKVTETICFNS